jgi:hypothetical protein
MTPSKVKSEMVSVSPQHQPSLRREEVLPEQSVDLAEDVEMPLPSNPQTFFLGGIFALAILAALKVASSIVLPIVLAFVLNLLLQPGVLLLERVRIPRAFGALLSIIVVIAALVGLVAALSVPATTWAQRLPEGIPRLEAHLKVLEGPIQLLQKTIEQAEQVGEAGGEPGSGCFGSTRSRPDRSSFCRDALGTRWLVYDRPRALLSIGSWRYILAPPRRDFTYIQQ